MTMVDIEQTLTLTEPNSIEPVPELCHVVQLRMDNLKLLPKIPKLEVI